MLAENSWMLMDGGPYEIGNSNFQSISSSAPFLGVLWAGWSPIPAFLEKWMEIDFHNMKLVSSFREVFS